MKNTALTISRKQLLFPFFFLLILVTGCTRRSDIRDVIRNDRSSFYYIDFAGYPAGNNALPIGIFDSGTGGLSVMADIIKHEGLAKESYIFMGDLANMPYGSYSFENNTPLLVEHVMKDVQFMMGNKYYRRDDSPSYETDKNPVKVIVIACNTATAYALDTVRNFLAGTGVDLGVIGVIDAGARGAFGNFSRGESGSIAVLATDGTVKSGAYPEAIRSVITEDGRPDNIMVFQQAGVGIAEAIDEKTDAIDRQASAPRDGYRGPSENGTGEMRIDTTLWNRYAFNTDSGALLFDGDIDRPLNIQINSVENYIRFNLVSLMEKVRKTEGAQPVNSFVLACTHYPFFEDTFRSEILRLRGYSENGEYIYRHLINDDFILVNPSSVVAEQLYNYLSAKGLLSTADPVGSEFFVSVPNILNRRVKVGDDGSFPYEYKYDRVAGETQEYVRVVPFSRTSIPPDMLGRLRKQIPEVFEMMASFNNGYPKTRYLTGEERIMME